MVEIKTESLKNPNFNSALAKLLHCTKFHPKLAMRVAKFMDHIKEQEIKTHHEYLALIRAHAKLDEKGELIPREDPNGNPKPNTFQAKDNDKWEKAFEEFGQKKITIDIYPLEIKDLVGLGLSPLEIVAIEPLITENRLELLEPQLSI